MTAAVVRDDPDGRRRAAGVLHEGGIVALPTDTVYGIAVRLDTPGGIERLFAAKRRPAEKGIMLLLADAAQAGEVGIIGPAAGALIAAFWPGGLSIVVPQRAGTDLPAILTGGAATIGLRLPDHPTPRALAAEVGPLPTTSANRSGWPEGRDAADIVEQIGDAVDLILDGGAAHGGPASTIVDCTGIAPRVLRSGAIAPADVAAVLHARGVSMDPGDS
jgi:L-threonylcarbamoyladenylate synthase